VAAKIIAKTRRKTSIDDNVLNKMLWKSEIQGFIKLIIINRNTR
jgi:hypothetical protein